MHPLSNSGCGVETDDRVDSQPRRSHQHPPLLEARASSEIESIVTTTDRLFQYRESDEQADSATKEALRYSQSLLEGFRTLSDHPLNTRTAEEVCSHIKGTTMPVRRVPGTALANDRTGKIIYTPPVGEDQLRDLLGNWERFLHESVELDPLVRMAVAHYQFEAIHPFTDGNGCTGRVLNRLFLIQEGLLTPCKGKAVKHVTVRDSFGRTPEPRSRRLSQSNHIDH
jgi:Fic family protein